MPDFLLELFSEEIPARMQARAADDLARLLGEALGALSLRDIRLFYGPRRIAISCGLDAAVPASTSEERGPRLGAPEAALAGFLRKHNAAREDLHEEGGFYVLRKSKPALPAEALIQTALPAVLRRFPWPKSMRWGGTSAFTWVRPLRRILCLLDGAPVPFTLAEGDDDGHGLVAGAASEGHRVHAPAEFAVRSAADWEEQLHRACVIADPLQRRARIAAGLAVAATEAEISIVPDDGLLDEVTGLVEWPVILRGRIDDAFMDLPPEVMQVSMRVNQRYFATRRPDGSAAPYFIFAANIEAPDGGAAIIAGNERVLRARFSDARHFWDLDRKTRLADRVPALDGVTFHAKLGTQGARARRIAALARILAADLGAEPHLADRAGLLAKADLTSGMVGEFPELQGVMGGYYARHDGEGDAVADAVREHYLPRGAGDALPAGPVSIAVALADKLDQLCGFFAVGEKPSGSGDPYALRRAALGIVRILREHRLRLGLRAVLGASLAQYGTQLGNLDAPALCEELLGFITERLRVQLRSEGARHDILSAVLAAGHDDDLLRVLARSDALGVLIGTDDGRNLLAAYKRAANILRIEEKKDGAIAASVDPALLVQEEEIALAAAHAASGAIRTLIAAEDFSAAVAVMAQLREPLDAFFTNVTVNAEDPALRANRLGLLAAMRARMNEIADFSAIEG